MAKRREILLADADVLIDYTKTDLSILSLVNKYTGPLYVLRQVLDTVNGLSESRCKRLGITIIEADTLVLLEAGKQSGPLSFEDWLCYLLCQQNRWICVTNDRVLIQICKNNGITYRRGLRLMIDLVNQGQLTRHKAIHIARAIHNTNPLHINKQILEQFIKMIEEK